MKPSDVLASTSKFSLTFQQNQIFLRLLELDFETDLAFALIKSYPEDLSFPDFLNRFISDENSILNHVFIPSNPNIFLCIICDQPESQHAKVPIEEEEKISKIYKEMTEPNKEEKSQISNVINTSIYKSKIRTTCKICFESKQEQFLFKLNFINHEICIDCLKKYITSEIIKGKLFPLKCPHCQIANLDLNIIKQFVDQTTFLKYQRLVIGYMIASNKEFLYCPGCFKIISKNECKTEKYVFFTTNSATMKMICPNCSIDICSNCYRRDHQTNKCEEIADFEMVNFGKAIDVQNCPNCKANVEKINGCHHMTCVCNYEFCWLCNGKYNFNHYNNEYSESETSMICPFRWRQEDVLRLNMTNINMNSCYENIDLKETNKVDEFALKSLANGEFMKIDKQKRKEKSQLICFLVIGIILSPILIIIFPIYFFLMDVMMSKCWISLMRDGNCLFKTIVLFFLLCFAICFLPILWIVMISKMCGYSKMRERKDQKYILFEETV